MSPNLLQIFDKILHGIPTLCAAEPPSEEFQTAKKAFAVLSNDRLRRVYDEVVGVPRGRDTPPQQ